MRNGHTYKHNDLFKQRLYCNNKHKREVLIKDIVNTITQPNSF